MAGLYGGDPVAPIDLLRAGGDVIPAGTGEVLGAVAGQAFEELPTRFVFEQQARNTRDTGIFVTPDGIPLRIDNPAATMTAEEANKEFKAPGMVPFSAPVSRETATEILAAHQRRIARESVVRRREGGIATGQAAQFATSMLTGMLDPLNIASAFIPVVPEAKVAAALAGTSGAFGRAGVRAGVGVASGAAGAVALEPLVFARDQAMQNDWTMGSAAMNIALGAAMGGVLHTGIGAVADWRASRADAAAAARVASLDAGTREMGMRGATAAVVEGRPVDVAEAARVTEEIRVVREIQADPTARPAIADMTLRGDLRAPESLLQFIAAKGGIQEQGGDLAAIGAPEHFVPGGGRIVRRDGMTLDYAREAAEEAGFLPANSTIRDFLDAVAEEVAGRRVLRPHDVAMAQERAQQRSVGHEEEVVARYRGEIEEIADAYGVRATPDEVDAAIRKAMDGEHPENALRDVLAQRDPNDPGVSAAELERGAALDNLDARVADTNRQIAELEARAAAVDGHAAQQLADLQKIQDDLDAIVQAERAGDRFSVEQERFLAEFDERAKFAEGDAKAAEAAGFCAAMRP